jgi:hypothetical protein
MADKHLRKVLGHISEEQDSFPDEESEKHDVKQIP